MRVAAWRAPDSERAARDPDRTLRVGIINIMPRAESYEGYLLRPLEAAARGVEPVWLRLESHVYSSSDAERVRSRYLPFEAALARLPLDGLILTGAPVEELAFEDVRYFAELRAILEHARRERLCTLGLCWGGLALGHLLGVPKVAFERKLFGVFEERPLDAASDITRGLGDPFPCVHSRHSGIDAVELERAAGEGSLRPLALGSETGYSMFESGDGVFLAHLGHPEYPARRLLEEWQRDTSLGRDGVEPPRNYDLNEPRATWLGQSDRFFANWLSRLQAQRQSSRAVRPSLARGGPPAARIGRCGPA